MNKYSITTHKEIVMLHWLQQTAAYMPRRVRPALKWHGGKFYLSRRIIQQLPQKRCYCEPFAGGANVFLNLVPGDWDRRVLADRNPKLITLYLAIRDHVDRLCARLATVPYTQDSFMRAVEDDEATVLDKSESGSTGIDLAVNYLVRMRMSRGGLGTAFAWSDRLRGGRPGDLNAWLNLIEGADGLAMVSKQLQGAEILCGDGLELLRQHQSSSDWVFYLDPPYMHQTRSAKNSYGEYEMNDSDHQDLAQAAGNVSGAVVISGYDSAAYERWYGNWRRVQWDMPVHAGQSKNKRYKQEILWIKDGPEECRGAPNLP